MRSAHRDTLPEQKGRVTYGEGNCRREVKTCEKELHIYRSQRIFSRIMSMILSLRSGGEAVRTEQKVYKDEEITFLTTASDSGYKTYVRGVTLLMLRSFYHIARNRGLENVLSSIRLVIIFTVRQRESR